MKGQSIACWLRRCSIVLGTPLLAVALYSCRGHAQPVKPAQPVEKLPQRWVYLQYNLQMDRNVEAVQTVLKRAKAAGYNGAVLVDYKFATLGQQPPEYFRNVEAVKATARDLEMDLYPGVCSIGYSHGLLSHDPNLAEGLPVKDALFVARGGEAHLAADPRVDLPGGGFEVTEADSVFGWDGQDHPGAASFVDTNIFHGRHRSLRMENVGTVDPENGKCRVQQRIKVAPFRQYHLSVWIRTESLEKPGAVKCVALGGTDDSGSQKERTLSFGQWQVRANQDWTQYHAVFNSLNNRDVTLYLGMWLAKGGKIWWDDAHLEEVGLLNLLRREGCPLEVRGEDGTVYEEGVDYEPARDSRLGRIPYAGQYEVYHAPPPIRLKAGTRIKEGERLRVSFYHAVVIRQGQVSCCLSDPRVQALLKDQIERVERLFHPKGFFMNNDEVRIANWCRTCQSRAMTPGQLVADITRRSVEMIRAANPKAEIIAWSDMFDPNHNAVDHYYLANGTLTGTWEGLPKDVIVANWLHSRWKASTAWFAERGHRQILAGYYDEDPAQIRAWLDSSKELNGISGVMYTTWEHRFDDLEAFAQAAWGPPVVPNTISGLR